jgi:hypothetical protein
LELFCKPKIIPKYKVYLKNLEGLNPKITENKTCSAKKGMQPKA